MTKPKHPSEYKKRGAPEWPYDPWIAEQICEAVATSTDSMQKIIAANPHFPSEQTIRKWRYKIPAFASMFTHAKQAQAQIFVDECMEIADDSSRDVMKNAKGEEVCDNEFVQRSRLRIDTRKWVACKLVPRIYGDKVQVEKTSPPKEAAAEIQEKMKRLKENEQPY